MLAIETKTLTKKYKDKTAVNGIDLKIEEMAQVKQLLLKCCLALFYLHLETLQLKV